MCLEPGLEAGGNSLLRKGGQAAAGSAGICKRMRLRMCKARPGEHGCLLHRGLSLRPLALPPCVALSLNRWSIVAHRSQAQPYTPCPS
jgi:hypothetical protein